MLLIIKNRSQRNMLNKSGPSIEPCRIPNKISSHLTIKYTYFSSLLLIQKGRCTLILQQIDWNHMPQVLLLKVLERNNQWHLINMSAGLQNNFLYLFLNSTFLTLQYSSIVDWYFFWNRIDTFKIFHKKYIFSNKSLSNNFDKFGRMLTGL